MNETYQLGSNSLTYLDILKGATPVLNIEFSGKSELLAISYDNARS